MVTVLHPHSKQLHSSSSQRNETSGQLRAGAVPFRPSSTSIPSSSVAVGSPSSSGSHKPPAAPKPLSSGIHPTFAGEFRSSSGASKLRNPETRVPKPLDPALEEKIKRNRQRSEELERRHRQVEQEAADYREEIKRASAEARRRAEVEAMAVEENNRAREAARQRKLDASAPWTPTQYSHRSGAKSSEAGGLSDREQSLSEVLYNVKTKEHSILMPTSTYPAQRPAVATREPQSPRNPEDRGFPSDWSTAQKPRRDPRDLTMGFSPGYGLRDVPPHLSEDQGAHRMYPAPSVVAPPVNADDGWGSDPEPSPRPSPALQTPDTARFENTGLRGLEYHRESIVDADDGGWGVPVKEYASEPPSPDPRPNSGGSYVPWQPVQYSSESSLPEPISRDELLEGLSKMSLARRPVEEDRPVGFRHTLDGRSPGDQNRRGFQTDFPDVLPQVHEDRPARERGRFSGGCRRCGEDGHWAQECPQTEASGRFGDSTCRRCGQEGHWARDCSNPRAGADRGCFGCGETGHISGDCPENRTPLAPEAVDSLPARLSGWDEEAPEERGDVPPVQRRHPTIHPDRLRMLGGLPNTSYNTQPQPPPPTTRWSDQRDGRAAALVPAVTNRQTGRPGDNVPVPVVKSGSFKPTPEDDDDGWGAPAARAPAPAPPVAEKPADDDPYDGW
ncbi:hypothetical protein M231_00399 [Tremella mesenterica]|uniref:CCHC-type domain-containing protein n=1 Tax=Tremella mesenterica TaxID=5217 RepID=A0A4Q1BW70_TREME|nr:hypothetical protein M231_00399 [Tremella mesenterica]